MSLFRGYASVQARGVVALPAELRRRYHLDEPGAQVEFVEREDGVIELRPTIAVAADQAWFWEQRWQDREREVDGHVVAGRTAHHDSVDELMDHLDRLDNQG